MNRGYIKIFRRLSEWEWYMDSHMVHLLLHCLIKANHTTKVWRGIPIGRGQFITGLDSLSRETGISVRSIRTCLKRMEGKELTSKTTNKFRVITINNYSTYQDAFELSDKPGDKQPTSKRQANDKQATATNNEKNVNNVKKEEEGVRVEENSSITAEDIYAAYPKKVDKGHAIPAIKKAMKKVQPAELLRCVQAYSGAVKGKTERKFIPNPSTWFNGERWADDEVKLIADRDLSAMPWDELVVLYKQHRPANCPTTNGLSMPREQIEERLAKILREKGI